MKKFCWIALVIIGLALDVLGQGLPANFAIRFQPRLSGLSSPVFMITPRDGTNRIFIVQQGGIVKVSQPDSNTTTDFLNITSRISSGGERGLLGLAFHPQYASNRRFFVYYTRSGDGAIQIAEYQTSASNPNVADTTEKVIITIPHPGNTNHNGGTVLFGSDGFLYAGPGDGGSGNDPPNNAQNINQLLGKIIRIDINTPVGGPPYVNPPSNPFFGATPGADEIYAVGMRNPYRFSFDRGGTNQLWAGDVGQSLYEEVDIITLGGNFGWRVYEGTNCTGLDPSLCNPANFIMPVFQYFNQGSPRCSVTGGYVYRGPQEHFPNGSYIYGDYCTGEVLIWHNSTQTPLVDTPRLISSFGEDDAGELYMIGHTSGTVEKIVRARASADFDGDYGTDISVFRGSTGFWYVLQSSNGTIRSQQFGGSQDTPAPEDYDGDSITDLGVFRQPTGTWHYFRSSDNTAVSIPWGTNGDIPAAGDYDGDAKADLTVYRPSSGVWYTLKSTNGAFSATPFGTATDRPTPGDYDGDGIYDISVWRGSTGVWYRINSVNNSFSATAWGSPGDAPAQGDFDGDGKLDQAVFRPSNGMWYVLRSTGGIQFTPWGTNSDVPVVGDYDRDGRDDIAVWRPNTSDWYILRGSNGSLLSATFGLPTDAPIPAFDTP